MASREGGKKAGREGGKGSEGREGGSKGGRRERKRGEGGRGRKGGKGGGEGREWREGRDEGFLEDVEHSGFGLAHINGFLGGTVLKGCDHGARAWGKRN